MTIRPFPCARPGHQPIGLRVNRPVLERLELRQLLSTADGNGPVVTGLAERVVHGVAAVIVTFDGPKYNVEFHAARRPAEHQMNIYTPEEVAAEAVPTTDVVVNVFAGSDREKVEYRLGESGEWRAMEQVRAADPYFVAMKKLEEGPTPPPGRKLPAAHKSTHMWRAKLADGVPPAPGTYLVHVRATDMFGKTHADQRAIRIIEAAPK